MLRGWYVEWDGEGKGKHKCSAVCSLDFYLNFASRMGISAPRFCVRSRLVLKRGSWLSSGMPMAAASFWNCLICVVFTRHVTYEKETSTGRTNQRTYTYLLVVAGPDHEHAVLALEGLVRHDRLVRRAPAA